MNPYDPLNLLFLHGSGVMRNVTLELPTPLVRSFLPPGLELGAQNMTRSGTHPVIMGFHYMIDEQTSLPSLMPPLTYSEHSMGIPYCYVTYGVPSPYAPGPFFYMPKLFVNNALAALGGRMFWGYNKELATIGNTENSFTVYNALNQPVLSLHYELVGEPKPVTAYRDFPLQQQAISQPLVSHWPFGLGPWYVAAGFPKVWQVATLQPMRAVVDIHAEYVSGLGTGRYPPTGHSSGIDSSVVGSYVLNAPFELSYPYFPLPNMPSVPLSAAA